MGIKKIMQLVIVGSLLGCLACYGMGCKSMAPKNFDDSMTMIDKIAKVAADNGVSWYADMTFDGAPRVFQHTDVGLNSGIKVTAHMQGNAQSGTGDGSRVAIKPQRDALLNPNAASSPGS